MIKPLLLFAVCCLFCCSAFTQSNNTDSLKKALDNYKTDDITKVQMLYAYSASLGDSNVTEAISYVKEGILIANKIHNPVMAAIGTISLSQDYMFLNRNDSAISLSLEGLNTAQQLHLYPEILLFYGQLGTSYSALNDTAKSIFYLKNYIRVAYTIRDTDLIYYGMGNLMITYDNEKNWSDMESLISKILPMLHYHKSDYQYAKIRALQAEEYYDLKNFRQTVNKWDTALVIWNVTDDYHELAYAQSMLCMVFTDMNNKDSAAYYGNASLATAEKNKLEKETGDAHNALFYYYKHFGNYKKALDEKLILDSLSNNGTSVKSAQTTLRAEIQYAQQQKDLQASVEKEKRDTEERRTRNWQYGIITAFILLAAFLLYNNRQKQRSKIKIEKAYSELKSTQAQLVQSEKMASLGELTAGIAHEIQNPLNFVNNFSEVNKELIEELKMKNEKLKIEEFDELLDDIAANSEKINHHGKRADAIVKGMLQHSRKNNGIKEVTDINALADEYLRLSYHGLRAKDKDFNADIKTDFDTTIEKINIVPQDIGRVLINLFTNAFYAVNARSKTAGKDYKPIVEVKTKKDTNRVIITVSDNGNGIPQAIIDKIFQPFFTTKPTGEGTGLGLSMSYDIITKENGGSINVISKEGEGSEFVIKLPVG